MTTKYRLHWETRDGKPGCDQPDFTSRKRAQAIADILNFHSTRYSDISRYRVEPVEVEEEQCNPEAPSTS